MKFVILLALLLSCHSVFAADWVEAGNNKTSGIFYIDKSSLQVTDPGKVRYWSKILPKTARYVGKVRIAYYLSLVEVHCADMFENTMQITYYDIGKHALYTDSEYTGQYLDPESDGERVAKKACSLCNNGKVNEQPVLIDTPLVKPEKVQSEMPIDFGPYLAELSRRLKRNWAPPTEDRILPVTVTIVIDHSGRLVSASILKSSGSASADSAVMAASKLSAPYRPLPSGQKYPSITVDCNFDYKSGIQGQTVLRLPASEATKLAPTSGFHFIN